MVEIQSSQQLATSLRKKTQIEPGNTRPGGILEDQLTRVKLLHLFLT